MEKFVISRRRAGLGDSIASLISAWQYAKKTGRTLVIDWRNSFYLKNHFENGFPSLFEEVNEIDAVPVISDESVAQMHFPSSTLYRRNLRSVLEVVADWVYRKLFAGEMPYILFAEDVKRFELSLLLSDFECTQKSIPIRTCVSDALPPLDECRKFLALLKPLPHIQAEIEAFSSQKFSGKKVVAVHVRHGNGGNTMGHGKYWIDRNAAIDRVLAEITDARQKLGRDSVVFLCSDSEEVQSVLQKAIPELITRDKYFRTRDAGELHGKGAVREGALAAKLGEDAIIEMYLLAQADVLIGYPAYSFFTFYARTVEGGPAEQKLISEI